MYVSFTLVSTPVLLGVDSKQPLDANSYDLSFVLLLFNFPLRNCVVVLHQISTILFKGT